MKKLLSIVSDSAEKKTLIEGVEEGCGMSPMGSSMPSTPPVTMSVNLNAQGVDNIKELLNLMRSAEAGHDHKLMGHGMDMPTVGLDMPIKVTKISGDDDSMKPAGSDGDRGMAQIRDLIAKADRPKEYSNSPEEAYAGIDSVTTDAGGGMQAPKDPADIRVKDPSGYTQAEEYANEPDEQYSDHNTMIKDLSGGLNREKRQYAKAQDGDNAMAVTQEGDDRAVYSQALRAATALKYDKPDPAFDAAFKKIEDQYSKDSRDLGLAQHMGGRKDPRDAVIQQKLDLRFKADLENLISDRQRKLGMRESTVLETSIRRQLDAMWQEIKENTVATWGAEQQRQFKEEDNAKELARKMASANNEFRMKYEAIQNKARAEFAAAEKEEAEMKKSGKKRDRSKPSSFQLAAFSETSGLKYLLSTYGIDPAKVDAKTFDPSKFQKKMP